MVSYHKVSLRLSRLQRRKLLKKHPVQVKGGKVGRGPLSEIFLNGHQMRAFRTRHGKGKGYRLKFSDAQLKHNVEHGSGFSDFFGKAVSAAKKGYSYIPDSVKDAVKDKALEYGKEVGKKLLDKAVKKFTGGSIIDDDIDNQIGQGVKRKGRGQPKKGRGIMAPGGGGIEAPGWRGGFAGPRFKGQDGGFFDNLLTGKRPVGIGGGIQAPGY